MTYNFTGTATCTSDYASVCGSSKISISGTYTMDPDEEYYAAPAPPGPWNFSISSSNSSYDGITIDSSISGSDREDDDDQYGAETDNFYFESPIGTSGKAEVDLTFSDPADGGTILLSGPGVYILNSGVWAHFQYDSGTATISDVVPEGSSTKLRH